MKRGFLNSEKAKRTLATEADVPQDSSTDKDKGKAKAERSYSKKKRRFIFRQWLRDPNGKVIVPSGIHGKEAGNGIEFWGATLYDFYFVRRIPKIDNFITISTGSKLTQVMKSFGELNFAHDELSWASCEADPMEMLPWDPAQAIAVHECRVHASSGVVHCKNKKASTLPEVPVAEHETDVQMLDAPQPTSDRVESRNDTVEAVKDLSPENPANKLSGEFTDSMNDVKTQQPPSDIPLESPFHPTHYPSPWPLVPFESTCSPFPLQRAIPIHLLPKKLYVHDPWNLLDAHTVDYDTRFTQEKETWSSKTDHIRTYTLSLPPDLKYMAEVTSKAAAAAEDEPLERTIFPRHTEGPTEQPAIRVVLSKKPRKPTDVPEAHLYISPKGRLGTGHHSIVYEADLELPRDLFCESTYCELCLDEQIQVEVDRLKESGEWERHLNEEAKKYKGQQFASHDATSSSSVQTPPRHVGFVKERIVHVPLQTMTMVAGRQVWETPVSEPPARHIARVSDPEVHHHVNYEGAEVLIYPNVRWQNPSFPETICVHQAKEKKPVPRTATFRVAVKLSLPYDSHLEREANNYLKFPAHFFQHWSGYNVVPPLHDPTPVGALVPQYFGYYTPDASSNSDEEVEYLSPILLLEHCGKQICIDKLPIDDLQECAALLLRFHYAGWLHASFAERNIVMQKRHPTCNPMEDDDCHSHHDSAYRGHSFRLIDFGRSFEYTEPSQRAVEEMEGRELLHLKF